LIYMKRLKYTWNKETIQALLDSNPKAVTNALIQIYDRQTSSEQAMGVTNVHNKVGFSGPDSEILSSFARFYSKYKYLSPKQMVIATRKMKKYWKQLMNIAIENGKNPKV